MHKGWGPKPGSNATLDRATKCSLNHTVCTTCSMCSARCSLVTGASLHTAPLQQSPPPPSHHITLHHITSPSHPPLPSRIQHTLCLHCSTQQHKAAQSSIPRQFIRPAHLPALPAGLAPPPSPSADTSEILGMRLLEVWVVTEGWLASWLACLFMPSFIPVAAPDVKLLLLVSTVADAPAPVACGP